MSVQVSPYPHVAHQARSVVPVVVKYEQRVLLSSAERKGFLGLYFLQQPVLAATPNRRRRSVFFPFIHCVRAASCMLAAPGTTGVLLPPRSCVFNTHITLTDVIGTEAMSWRREGDVVCQLLVSY